MVNQSRTSSRTLDASKRQHSGPGTLAISKRVNWIDKDANQDVSELEGPSCGSSCSLTASGLDNKLYKGQNLPEAELVAKANFQTYSVIILSSDWTQAFLLDLLRLTPSSGGSVRQGRQDVRRR